MRQMMMMGALAAALGALAGCSSGPYCLPADCDHCVDTEFARCPGQQRARCWVVESAGGTETPYASRCEYDGSGETPEPTCDFIDPEVEPTCD